MSIGSETDRKMRRDDEIRRQLVATLPEHDWFSIADVYHALDYSALAFHVERPTFACVGRILRQMFDAGDLTKRRDPDDGRAVQYRRRTR